MAREQTTGEEVANTVTHVVGSHLGAAMTALLVWVAVGGGLYTLGCVFYLWKSLPYAHMVWHLFVLAGTICHFFCILWHVMP